MGYGIRAFSGYVAVKAIDDLILREGGYVNHPKDKGGPTKFGITEKTAREHGYSGDVKDLPRELAERIYLETYYRKTGISRITSHAVAEELLDSAVLHGPGSAIRWLQRALNRLNKNGTLYNDLKEDGVLGSITIAALDAYLKHRKNEGGELVLVRALNCLQGASMLDYGDYSEDFIFGWLRHRVAL